MTIYALVDCNNFYSSCERVFDPKLNGKPIIVLSNNDGCVIARSDEARKLGISMGAPFHEWKKFCKSNSVHVFSSNYELYGDMSHRVMTTLRYFCPDIEIYSIDEAFLILDGFTHKNLADFVLDIKEKVRQWTGLPVSIGFSHTKTLAKVANKIAKKETKQGVFDLTNAIKQNEILDRFLVEDIWGIGRQLSKKLIHQLNITTAKQLRDADPKQVRAHFSVIIEKIIYELRGTSCIPIETIQPKKQIMCSRSFGKLITEFEDLAEAISYHVTNACIKLRKQKSVAHGVYVFLETNRFRLQDQQYKNNISYFFPDATDDTGYIIKIATQCLRSIYKNGYRYNKAGIMLLDLMPNDIQQLSLFCESHTLHKNGLMKTIDQINQLMGKNTIFHCSQGVNQTWHIKRELRSPRYTTRIDELFTAYC